MRSFYGQRCGTAVDLGPEFPGYAHAACHRQAAWHASSGRTTGPAPLGGWHDAGDYGRYVVNSGITTGTLLWAFDLHRSRLEGLRLDIPESSNGVPDVLDEIRYNLDWMLAMQDADGGVFAKETSEGFTGFVMPEADPLTSYVIGTGSAPFKSSCATADFTAVMSIAARVYKPVDAAFSERALRAARSAWGWVGKNPDVAFKNPKGVVTGEYGDDNCGDERLWAAAELWRAGGDQDAHRVFLEQAPRYRSTLRAVGPPAWPEVAPLALWSYALAPGQDKALVDGIREDTRKAAIEIVTRSAGNGYRISMTTTDYVWGSNGVVANYGLLLLVANALSPDPRFVDAALDNLHYLLGRNAFSLSFVTGVGASPFKKPHHRPSAADRNALPWPGLLSGGPNRLRQDPVMQKLPNLPAARMYVDDEGSYASNENAINWNAPLVFLLTGASAHGRR
jgi:endoglucanase